MADVKALMQERIKVLDEASKAYMRVERKS